MSGCNFLDIVPGHKIYYIHNDRIFAATVVDVEQDDKKIWIALPGGKRCFDFNYSLSSNGFFYPSKFSAQMQLLRMNQQKDIMKEFIK